MPPSCAPGPVTTTRPTDPGDLEPGRGIYEVSFPAGQREPWELIVERVHAGCTQVHLAWRDGQVVGLGIAYVLPACQAGYVSHLAVAPHARGTGVASIIAELGAGFVASEAPTGYLVEIDDPTSPDPDVAKHGAMLETMYTRWGASVVAAAGYRMPDLVDPDLLVPMRLLWFPGDLPGEQVTGPVRARLVSELWQVVYGIGPTDPRAVAMLADLV